MDWVNAKLDLIPALAGEGGMLSPSVPHPAPSPPASTTPKTTHSAPKTVSSTPMPVQGPETASHTRLPRGLHGEWRVYASRGANARKAFLEKKGEQYGRLETTLKNEVADGYYLRHHAEIERLVERAGELDIVERMGGKEGMGEEAKKMGKGGIRIVCDEDGDSETGSAASTLRKGYDNSKMAEAVPETGRVVRGGLESEDNDNEDKDGA